VTSSLGDREGAREHDDVRAYVEAVERHRARAVPLRNDATSLEAALALVDGLLLSGGCDVDVALYGGRALPSVQAPDRERDAFEVAIVRAARDRGVPTLCVCRGMQVANVAFGGTLIEDLPRDLGHGLEHDGYAPEHEVRVEAHSALAGLLGATAFATNSTHHQAVRDVAPGLRAVASTGDGVIEALEAAFPHPFFFAVQWHPEELPADDPIALGLFRGLVAAASRAGGAA
jgi:putative glutamine amidotransferase